TTTKTSTIFFPTMPTAEIKAEPSDSTSIMSNSPSNLAISHSIRTNSIAPMEISQHDTTSTSL
ncbi:hypothetical protein, partial [Salmonella sp. s51228]|uniref:hypothetical protein n=1 Tax=Salmonella sp. s51228 TaxID=3159652 RepID=UPI00397FB6E1